MRIPPSEIENRTRWTPAQHLQVGDWVSDSHGTLSVVTAAQLHFNVFLRLATDGHQLPRSVGFIVGEDRELRRVVKDAPAVPTWIEESERIEEGDHVVLIGEPLNPAIAHGERGVVVQLSAVGDGLHVAYAPRDNREHDALPLDRWPTIEVERSEVILPETAELLYWQSVLGRDDNLEARPVLDAPNVEGFVVQGLSQHESDTLTEFESVTSYGLDGASAVARMIQLRPLTRYSQHLYRDGLLTSPAKVMQSELRGRNKQVAAATLAEALAERALDEGVTDRRIATVVDEWHALAGYASLIPNAVAIETSKITGIPAFDFQRASRVVCRSTPAF